MDEAQLIRVWLERALAKAPELTDTTWKAVEVVLDRSLACPREEEAS